MCPVKVRFYLIDDSGEEVDLSGAARFNSQYGGGTNEEIRKILGTFDDFIHRTGRIGFSWLKTSFKNVFDWFWIVDAVILTKKF